MTGGIKALLIIIALLLAGILVFLVANRAGSQDDKAAAALSQRLYGIQPATPWEKRQARGLLAAMRQAEHDVNRRLGEQAQQMRHFEELGNEALVGVAAMARIYRDRGFCDELFREGDRLVSRIDAITRVATQRGAAAEVASLDSVGSAVRVWLANTRALYWVNQNRGVLIMNANEVREVERLPDSSRPFVDLRLVGKGKLVFCQCLDSVVRTRRTDTVTAYCQVLFIQK